MGGFSENVQVRRKLRIWAFLFEKKILSIFQKEVAK